MTRARSKKFARTRCEHCPHLPLLQTLPPGSSGISSLVMGKSAKATKRTVSKACPIRFPYPSLISLIVQKKIKSTLPGAAGPSGVTKTVSEVKGESASAKRRKSLRAKVDKVRL